MPVIAKPTGKLISQLRATALEDRLALLLQVLSRSRSAATPRSTIGDSTVLRRGGHQNL